MKPPRAIQPIVTACLLHALAACSAPSPPARDAAVECSATPAPDDPLAAMRAACAFGPGARVADTLGLDPATRARIPVDHVIIVVQENRSFDHYFSQLAAGAQPDSEPLPASYTNLDNSGVAVSPYHLTSPCLPADPGHQWDSMHAAWHDGAMDGFVTNAATTTGGDGHFAVGYFDATDLPFYYWLASTFTLADRYFAPTLGGTWPNRDYLYAASSYGVHSTDEATIPGRPTVFDQLDTAGVAWGVFTDGAPRQDCLGWSATHRGVAGIDVLMARLRDGTLPPVAFVDPAGASDEHPPNDVQHGEAWSRGIYQAAVASPLWPRLAVFFTYDEGGALFDHVPPPAACVASPDQTEFDHLGMRVPMVLVSPWARPHAVSHRVHEHTSVLRFVQALFDLPALTARDANADAMLDLFDFGCPQLAAPPPAPEAGHAPACP